MDSTKGKIIFGFFILVLNFGKFTTFWNFSNLENEIPTHNTLSVNDSITKKIDFYLDEMLDSNYSKKEIFHLSIKIMKFEKKHFLKHHYQKIKEIFNDSSKINNGTILLVGKMEINDSVVVGQLKKLIHSDTLGYFNTLLSVYSNEWCAHLALAKIGKEEHISFIKNMIFTNKKRVKLLSHVFNQLMYIGNDMAIQVLMDYSLSMETYICETESGFGSYIEIRNCNICYSPCLYLSKMLKDFPVKYPSTKELYTKSVKIQIMQNWVNNNRTEFEIIPNYLEKQISNIVDNEYFLFEDKNKRWIFIETPH